MAELTEEQLKVEWDKADTDKSGSLSFKEVVGLLDKFNLKLKEKQAKKIFKEVDEDGSGQLDFNEFRQLLSLLRTRPEVEQLFDSLYEQFHDDEEDDGTKAKVWTAEEFLQFLKEVQKETDVDLETAKAIIKACEHKKKKDDKDATLSVKGLNAYMSGSKYNSIFNSQQKKVYQDMTQPFTHYFIASSHNTYLLGDQLKGESSVEAYKNAFKKGCKCVELDCWDGEDKNPIIYHGHTLTSKITFKEVVETVRDFGFLVSDYPVILSLEVHCSNEGQQNMAKILRDVLGTAGMLPPAPEDTGVLPPPDQLKRKVLLKGKRLPTPKKGEAQPEPEEEEEEDDEEEDAEPPKDNTEEGKKDLKTSKTDAKVEGKKEKKKKEHHSTAKELSDLIHLKTCGVKDFKENKAKQPPSWAMSSFSESKVEKILAKQAADFIDYNARQLSRIYPKGIRFDSSNYDPVPSWNCGSQIVALNYQTGSEPMWLNDGKFQDNGGCGFILKPKYMRENEISFNPANPGPVQKTLIINLISGWQFPKSHGKESKEKGEIIDPYVRIQLTGVAKDKIEVRTKTIKNNGFNPTWNAEFKFPITTPELAILMFTVMDEDLVSKDDFIGQYALNVSNIREGYRVIPLKDKKGGDYEKASLLVNISWEDSDSKTKQTAKVEGVLTKKGDSSFTNKWNQRYFVLQNAELSYYISKNDVNKKPRGTYNIKNVVCSPVKASTANHEHTFMIMHRQKNLVLKAENAQELRKWKRNLLIQGAKWQPKSGAEYLIQSNGSVQKKK